MRIALIIVAVVVLILVLLFVVFSPFDNAQELDDPQTSNNEGIDETVLPGDIPVYPGASFISHTENEDEDIFEFQTTDSTEDVSAFYVAEFEARGYEDFYSYYDDETAEMQVQSNDQLITVMADAENDTTVIRISVRPVE